MAGVNAGKCTMFKLVALSPKCGENVQHLIYKGKYGSIKQNMTDSGENCHGFNKSQSSRCSPVRNEKCINSSPLKGQGGTKIA